MWRSNSKPFLVGPICCILFFGCEREKSEAKLQQPQQQAQSPAQTSSSAPQTSTRDTSTVKPETTKVSFDIPIKGYQATRLGEAIYNDSLDLFKSLLEKGAPLNKSLTDGTYEYDALYAALAFDKRDILEYIMQQKKFSDINETYSEDAETPLTMACTIKNKADALAVSKVLVENGANVNGAGPSGGERTKYPLLSAVNQDNVELVKYLIEKGAKKDIADNSGKSPGAIAVEKGFSDLAALLQQ